MSAEKIQTGNQYQSATDVSFYEASRYATKDQHLISRREQNVVVSLLATLSAPRGMILDAPCGYGRFTPHILQRGWKPVNVDLAQPMVDHTIAAAKKLYNVDLTGQAASLFVELPFAADSFDGAVCIRMLHNLLSSEDRVKSMKSLARVVNDWVLITYYNKPLLHALQYQFRKKFNAKARQTMSMITNEQFAAEAKLAGLRVESDVAALPILHAQRIALLRKIK